MIAGLGMIVIDSPPHPSHPADHRRAYILKSRRDRAPPQGTGQAVDGAGRGKGSRARHPLCEHSFDAAGPSAVQSLGQGPTSEIAIQSE